MLSIYNLSLKNIFILGFFNSSYIEKMAFKQQGIFQKIKWTKGCCVLYNVAQK